MVEPESAEPAAPPTTTSESEAGDEDLLDLLRRERADFLNYKRRVERERAEDRKRAWVELLERILPLLDELDRAFTQVPEDIAGHPWVLGVVLSRDRLVEALAGLGVDRTGVVGEPFDPEFHEALTYQARPDVDERRVAAVIRAGYRLGHRLLRPAQVSVIGPPESTADRGPDQEAVREQEA